MSTNTKLAEALHPFVLANSSEEHITLVVRTADVARARAALAAHDAEQAAQAVPAVRVADVGFRWDGEKQQHVPTLLVEFEPVPANSGSDAKGWRDRDAMAAMLSAAPRPGAAAGWQPIETAPKDGRKMLLFYLNANGQARRVIGGWVTAEEAAETDADDVGLEAGWYERIDNWPDYYQVAINEGEPTHWMPLPAAPQEPTHG